MALLPQVIRAVGVNVGYRRPLYAHYGVTHRCNMRCLMCNIWKSADPSRELTLPEVATLADQLRKAGILTIALGGGEPFIRNDIAEIVALFSARGISVRLLTNGIGIADEKIDAVIEAGIDHVSISLDSRDPVRQQKIYGGQDVWQEIVDTMGRFRRRLPPDASAPVMNVVVSQLNLDELPGLVDVAGEQGFYCSFVPISLAASEEESNGFAATAPEMAFQPSDHPRIREAYGELIRLKRRGAPIANSTRFLRHSIDYLRTGKAPWSCDAGRLYLSVNPEGEISICHHFAPLGRFDEIDLPRLLKDRDVKKEAARQRRDCPGCMRPCWAEVTHALRHPLSAIEALKVHLGKPGMWSEKEGERP